MLNWIKKLFGIKNTQPCPETQDTMVDAVYADYSVDQSVAVAEPVVAPEPVAVAEPVAAGKQPGKKEKKTPAKPKKKAETKITVVVAEEPVRKGRKTSALLPATIKTTTTKSRKK